MLKRLTFIPFILAALVFYHRVGFAESTNVDMDKFIKLMEQYTSYTKNVPQSSAEIEETNSLIDQIKQDQIKIREEVKRIKFFIENSSPHDLKRLEQANTSAETALRELYKRQNQIRALAYQEK